MRTGPANLGVRLAVAASFAAAIFLLDLALPLLAAGGAPYVALVLLGWWFDERRGIVLLGAIATVLAVLGYLALAIFWSDTRRP